jgi:hypothetical protein
MQAALCSCDRDAHMRRIIELIEVANLSQRLQVLQPGALSHPPERPLTFSGQTKSMTEWVSQATMATSARSPGRNRCC